jgi:flagellar basal-body rod protein FlgB
MIGKLDETLRFQQTALSLRAQRQQIIASNIANADTPNYKARDIDFNSALKEAMGGPTVSTAAAGKAGALAKTAAGHLPGLSGPGSLPDRTADGKPLLYRGTVQGAVDGNTVDMDAERNQFTDNALRYEASVTFIGSQIKGLLSAIQGQ